MTVRRFRWRLQKILKIRQNQEDVIRERLVRLSGEMARRKRKIQHLRENLRRIGQDLDQRPDRWRDREIFLHAARLVDEQVDQLRAELDRARQDKQRALQAFETAMRARKTLERLRQESLSRHQTQMAKIEQGLLDEGAHHRITRGLLAGD